MTLTGKGYAVSGGYVTDIIVASWNKDTKDFDLILIKNDKERNKYSLPRRYVSVEHNETAIDSARIEIKDKTGLDILMFRHIAVFDDPKREPNKYIVSNVMLGIVKGLRNLDLQDSVEIFSLSEINNMDLLFDHSEIVDKFARVIDYDIYSQIFDTKKFGSDFIVSLLGSEFTTSELIDIAKWAGRRENKTTFYRNIDNNYKFSKKVGRNKYYTQK